MPYVGTPVCAIQFTASCEPLTSALLLIHCCSHFFHSFFSCLLEMTLLSSSNCFILLVILSTSPSSPPQSSMHPNLSTHTLMAIWSMVVLLHPKSLQLHSQSPWSILHLDHVPGPWQGRLLLNNLYMSIYCLHQLTPIPSTLSVCPTICKDSSLHVFFFFFKNNLYSRRQAMGQDWSVTKNRYNLDSRR